MRCRDLIPLALAGTLLLPIAPTLIFALEPDLTRPAADRSGIPGEGFEGAWLGELWAPAGKLRVLVKLFEKDGQLSGSLDSLDERVGGLEIHSALQFGDQLQFELTQPQAAFYGQMSPEGAEIVGRWKQDGAESSLILRRLDGHPANPD